MAKIINFAKMIRRNWKKSTLFFGLVAYGTSYGVEKYQTFQMMRAYCEEAKEFGEKIVPSTLKPKHITVILNPEANDKKSNIQFEKFAAPLLHLAGYKVSMFQTENEKQARDLMVVMANTDAVLIAGGDGTVHEAVTGLLRRPVNEDEYLPLGIIPLGKTNTVANHLFGSKASSRAQLMAEAAMAVIREKTVSLDVMKVEHIEDENPVYAVSSFEQGVFAEVEPKVQKYWYLGGLKDKYTYFMNAFKDHNPVKYSQLQYVAPCGGCSRCYAPPKVKEKSYEGGRWWSAFVPKKTNTKSYEAHEDFSKVTNEECGKILSLESSFSNFSVYTSSAQSQNNTSGMLFVKMYPKDLSFKQFLTSGLNHRKSKLQSSSDCMIVNAREVKIETENPILNKAEFPSIQAEIPNTKAEIPYSETANTKAEILNAKTAILNVEAQVVPNTEAGILHNAEAQVLNTEADILNTEADILNTEAQVLNTEIDILIPEAQVHNTKVEIPKTEESSSEKTEVYCYIDKEKYKITSCDITLLPKRVIVFG